MRTTITLDDDVASKLIPLLEKSRGKSKKVINDLLRQALGIKPLKKVDIPVFHIGLKSGIDPTYLNKLGEELALAEDLERYQR